MRRMHFFLIHETSPTPKINVLQLPLLITLVTFLSCFLEIVHHGVFCKRFARDDIHSFRFSLFLLYLYAEYLDSCFVSRATYHRSRRYKIISDLMSTRVNAESKIESAVKSEIQ